MVEITTPQYVYGGRCNSSQKPFMAGFIELEEKFVHQGRIFSAWFPCSQVRLSEISFRQLENVERIIV